MRGNNIAVSLFIDVIDACRRGVEEALDAKIAGGYQHVGVDQDVEHAERLVVFDEAHTAHVRGQLVDCGRPCGGGIAVVLVSEIEREVLHAVSELMPLVEWLDVHGANVVEATAKEALDDVSANKAASSPQTTTLSPLYFTKDSRAILNFMQIEFKLRTQCLGS